MGLTALSELIEITFFTFSFTAAFAILCVPIMNKDGECIGCTQALNKTGGGFTEEDESRLKAFTQQVAIALENAKLFEDVSKERAKSLSQYYQYTNHGNLLHMLRKG